MNALSVTSDNIRDHVLNEIPEFEPVYSSLAARDAEKRRGIDKPQRLLYHLAYFAVHAVAKAKSPELAGPKFDDLDDLLSRVMEVVEDAATSPDPEVTEAVAVDFLRVLYLMQQRQEAIIKYAGPETLVLWNQYQT